MGKCRFVTPETVRLELSDGDWIEVKKRLSWGEQQKLSGSTFGGVRGVGGGETEFTMEWERYQVLRLATWIVDWSFTDAKGKQVKVSRDAIGNLDQGTAEEIDVALTGHIEAQEVERDPETAKQAIERHEQAIAALEAAKNGVTPGETGPC